MDTRLLYTLAVIIALVSGGYYYYSDINHKIKVDTAQNMTYSADAVQMLQTDEQGIVNVRAQVDHLEQNLQDKSSKLTNLNVSMYRNDQIDINFQADQGQGLNDNEKVILSGNVRAVKNSTGGQLKFFTDELTGYPKLGTLETKHQVRVESPGGLFLSQGLTADLNQGQFDFSNIRGTYAPQ